MPADDVEVVVVAYHSYGLLEALLGTWPPDLPVAVVDNADGADRLDELLARRALGRYLKGGGVGFARAANLGARTSAADYLVFVNPDTRPTVDQLRALVDDLAADTRLAAVAATTVTPEGRVELGTGGWEPSVRRALVYASGAHALLPKAGLYARPEPQQPIDLDWLTGACLAVPRRTFLELGGFDEQYFVYNEDMAYGRHLREAGYTQRLRTDVLVPHAGGGSGGGMTTMQQMRGASMIAYLGHHNPPRTQAVIRVILSLGAAGRWMVCRTTGRQEAARNYAAYLRGMWRGAPDMGVASPSPP